MVKKVYYEKIGRRYVPVREYDDDLMDSFEHGNHLVMCYPGGASRRYKIEANYAAMIAAGRIAEDAISKSLMQATEIRRQQRHTTNEPLTPDQKAAWENLVAAFGDDAKQLEWPSVRECAEKAVQAMQEEASKLMQNDAVKLAYEHFQMVCDITAGYKNEST